jgi:hypothetical protein
MDGKDYVSFKQPVRTAQQTPSISAVKTKSVTAV